MTTTTNTYTRQNNPSSSYFHLPILLHPDQTAMDLLQHTQDTYRDACLDIVKFFPAEAAGGLKLLKAMSEPYPNVRFMPTGGISPENVSDYLTFSKVICCGGSWITKPAKEGNYAAVTKAAAEAMELVKRIRG